MLATYTDSSSAYSSSDILAATGVQSVGPDLTCPVQHPSYLPGQQYSEYWESQIPSLPPPSPLASSIQVTNSHLDLLKKFRNFLKFYFIIWKNLFLLYFMEINLAIKINFHKIFFFAIENWQGRFKQFGGQSYSCFYSNSRMLSQLKK